MKYCERGIYNKLVVLIWICLIHAVYNDLPCGRPPMVKYTHMIVNKNMARFMCVSSSLTLIGPSHVKCDDLNPYQVPSAPICIINLLNNITREYINQRTIFHLTQPVNKNILFVVTRNYMPMAIDLIMPDLQDEEYPCHYQDKLSKYFVIDDDLKWYFYICILQQNNNVSNVDLHIQENMLALPKYEYATIAFWAPFLTKCGTAPRFHQCKNTRIWSNSNPIIVVAPYNSSQGLYKNGKRTSHLLVECHPYLKIWQWEEGNYECQLLPDHITGHQDVNNTNINNTFDSTAGSYDSNLIKINNSILSLKPALSLNLTFSLLDHSNVNDSLEYFNDQGYPISNETAISTTNVIYDLVELINRIQNKENSKNNHIPRPVFSIDWEQVKRTLENEFFLNTQVADNTSIATSNDMWWNNSTFMYSMVSVVCTTILTIFIRICCRCCPGRCRRVANNAIITNDELYKRCSAKTTQNEPNQLITSVNSQAQVKTVLAPTSLVTVQKKNIHLPLKKDKKLVTNIVKATHYYQPSLQSSINNTII